MRSFGIPVRNSVAIGIGAGVGQNSVTAQARAVMALFQNVSEYDFTTPSGAYQTSAGPAAVAVNDPIGLELDAMGTVGPEITGGLTTPANWTLFGGATLNAGVAALPVAGAQIFNTIGTVSGNWYLVTFTVSASTAGLYLNAYAGGTGAFGIATGVSDGVKFCYLKATSAAVVSVQNDPGSTGTCSVSNISCVQVPGNHATQTTAINRPTVQRGLWNFLSQSSNFASGDWIAASSGTYTVNSDAVAGPYDGTTADVITASPTGLVYVTQAITASAVKYTEALWVKLISGSGSINLKVGTELDAGTVLTPAWQMISYSSVSAVSAGYCQISFVLPNNSVVAVYSAGLFQGTLTAAQILAQGGIPLTTSAAGSNPTAGPVWAQFINASALRLDAAAVGVAADDYFVIATFKPDSVATNRTFACPIGNAAGNRLAQLRVNSTGILQAIWNDASAASVVDVVSSNDTLITGTAFKRGANIFLRKNAVQLATGVAPAALASMPGSSIGSNNATGAPELASGNGYHVIWGKGSPTNEQFTAMERYSASKVGLII